MVLILGIISVVILIFIFIISPIVTVVAGAAMLIGYALWRFIKRGCKFRRRVNLAPIMRWSPRRWTKWWIILTVAMFLLGIADLVFGEEGNSIIFGEGNGEYLLSISLMFLLFLMVSPLIGNVPEEYYGCVVTEEEEVEYSPENLISKDIKNAKTKFCAFDYLMTLFDKYGVSWYNEASVIRVLTKEQLRNLREEFFTLEKEMQSGAFTEEKFVLLKERLQAEYKLDIGEYVYDGDVDNYDFNTNKLYRTTKSNYITRKIYDILIECIGLQQVLWHDVQAGTFYVGLLLIPIKELKDKIKKDENEYDIPDDVPF